MSVEEIQRPAWAVDESRVVPRAVELVEVFREALAAMVRDHALTFEELTAAASVLEQLVKSGAPLELALMPLYGDLFQRKEGNHTLTDIAGPMYLRDAPFMSNPGVLPMRSDEPGVPLIARGRVSAGDGSPLAGAELDIFQAAMNGNYSTLGLDDQPHWNLRARQLADAEGRYEFRAITSPPYLFSPLPAVIDAAAVLGRSSHRPAHIHYVIRHQDLVEDFANEVYFKGDPTIEHDLISPGFAAPELQADVVYHDDPEEIVAAGLDRPFNTLEFDFVLKTKSDTGTAATTARGE